ncbi:hypothetical protein [Zavarzinia sp.]|uniref:hypothetical protein n=1 Tax=Zavarzinia sp. TaxID=2027920 RepID=UPI00356B3CB6
MASAILDLFTRFGAGRVLAADFTSLDLRGSLDYLVDNATTPEGMAVIAAVLLGAWFAFRAFR